MHDKLRCDKLDDFILSIDSSQDVRRNLNLFKLNLYEIQRILGYSVKYYSGYDIFVGGGFLTNILSGSLSAFEDIGSNYEIYGNDIDLYVPEELFKTVSEDVGEVSKKKQSDDLDLQLKTKFAKKQYSDSKQNFNMIKIQFMKFVSGFDVDIIFYNMNDPLRFLIQTNNDYEFGENLIYYSSPIEKIIHSFDISVCKFITDGEYVYYYDTSYNDLINKRFRKVYSNIMLENTYLNISRTIKYCLKGFEPDLNEISD